MSDRQLNDLRRAFRIGNRIVVLWSRLGLGRLLRGRWIGWTMVLVSRGHRSGLPRRVPVNFEREPDAVTCLASFGSRTHWYRNLQADPHCELWLPEGRWSGEAVDVGDAAARRLVMRRVLLRSGMPVRLFEGLNPAHLSDQELSVLLERYEPVRIELREPLEPRAPGGPGDFSWVTWAVLGAGIGALVAGQARRHRERRPGRLPRARLAP